MTAHALRIAVGLALLLGALPTMSPAQSLADIARATSASRKEQPKAGKVYTNGDLRADITASDPSAPTAGVTSADSTAGASAGADAGDGKDAGGARDEKYWRGRITSARDALERAERFAEALQSQINGLMVEFVNRDDPAQRAQIEQRRTKAVADLERTQREIADHRKAIATVEDDARKAGVPAGWLR